MSVNEGESWFLKRNVKSMVDYGIFRYEPVRKDIGRRKKSKSIIYRVRSWMIKRERMGEEDNKEDK